jgi:dTDP-4-dehydrorhamnose 3,5-epimerase
VLFHESPLAGAYRIQIEKRCDERGFFARSFCQEEFEEKKLISRFTQVSISFNIRRGTVRGMHFASEPHAETKIVRCTSGVIYDVIVDLRMESPTYLQTYGVELSADNRDALYIPIGFAHGFQTLREDSEVLYQIDKIYVAAAARGIRWNDPALTMNWPEPISTISQRDLDFPDWKP